MLKGTGACTCCLQSDAVRCETRGGQSHSIWLSAERAGLVLRLGSAPLQGCSATGRGLRSASRTSRLVRTRIGRDPESRGAKLRGAVSSARRPKLLSVCHVRGTGGPCLLAVVVVAAGGGRGPTPLRCHPRKTGADLMGSYASLPLPRLLPGRGGLGLRPPQHMPELPEECGG